MTSKPSHTPWADEPFHLIPTPSERPELADEKHSFVGASSEMSHAHNAIIRGLNAIIQQAPYVKASTEPGYSAKDVKDLLCYVSSWVKMVHHHHGVEETFIFPEVEKLSGRKGFMDDPKHQHEVFHDGLERLLEYAESTTTSPQNYRWTGPEGMKQIVDSFSKDLTDHLYAEIDLFLAMGDLDNEGLKKVWKEGAAEAKKQSSLGLLYDVFPCVLGAADKTFEGGVHDFPPLPLVLPYIVKYWFAAGNGAWRFSPCDFWGKPRPLAFGPDQQS